MLLLGTLALAVAAPPPPESPHVMNHGGVPYQISNPEGYVPTFLCFGRGVFHQLIDIISFDFFIILPDGVRFTPWRHDVHVCTCVRV